MLKKIKRGAKKIVKKAEEIIETNISIANKIYDDISGFVKEGDNKIAIGLSVCVLYVVSGILQNIRESK